MSATPQEVIAAKNFLVTRKIKLPARKFASAAKETGKSFNSLARFISKLYRGEQDQPQQLRERMSAITGVDNES